MKLLCFEEKYTGDVIELWNRCLPQDLIDAGTFRYKVTGDENFRNELAVCAFDGERLCGFGYGICRRVPYYERGLEIGTGWLCMLFVDPEYRSRKIGSAICESIENGLREQGVKTVILGAYSPHYFVPGVDAASDAAIAFFKSRGYTFGDKSYSMRRMLFGYEIPPDVQKKIDEAKGRGYNFCHYSQPYREKLFSFITRNFSPGWHRNAMLLVENDLAEMQLFICVSPKDEVVGFCMRGMDMNPNRFGPFGIDKECRNQSLGSALFCYALREIACGGIYFIYFQSTDDAGKRFYERQQMECYRTFYHGSREL